MNTLQIASIDWVFLVNPTYGDERSHLALESDRTME